MPSSCDPEIICFQHCSQESRIFCLEVPDNCPVCGDAIDFKDILKSGQDVPEDHQEKGKITFLTTPFFIPCPFVDGSQAGCSLLIRPTLGDFLHAYRSSSDLHIGITDSYGNVYEYDSRGVRKTCVEDVVSSRLWRQSLVIPVWKDVNRNNRKEESAQDGDNFPGNQIRLGSKWIQHWDYTLSITAGMDNWSSHGYSETGSNCYSFVLFFLKMLKLKHLNKTSSLSCKTQFCQEYILPRTRLAAKYIALYRQVIREGVSTLPVRLSSPSPLTSSPSVTGTETDDSALVVVPETQIASLSLSSSSDTISSTSLPSSSSSPLSSSVLTTNSDDDRGNKE